MVFGHLVHCVKQFLSVYKTLSLTRTVSLIFQLVKTFAPPNQLQPYLPVIAPYELVIPVNVGPLGFATYFVSNQASKLFSDTEAIWATTSKKETKATIVLKNEVIALLGFKDHCNNMGCTLRVQSWGA
jgi:hypothetical protein